MIAFSDAIADPRAMADERVVSNQIRNIKVRLSEIPMQKYERAQSETGEPNIQSTGSNLLGVTTY